MTATLDIEHWKERVVGFFPVFHNLAETSRLARIAGRYRKPGKKNILGTGGSS